MTKIAAKPVVPRTIDTAQLEQLVEPLTVTVHKLRSGHFSPIILPVGESGVAGVGFSKEEIMGFDSWLVNHWVGGGMYEVNVTDSTAPVPQKLTWRPFWPTTEYPEKIPPTMADSARPSLIQTQQVQQQQQPQPMQVPTMGQFPNGLPAGGFVMQTPYSTPVPQQTPYYVQPQNNTFNPYAMQADADRRRLEERLNATEAALQRANLETQQRAYQADLERERAANTQAMQRLEARLTEVTAQPRGPNAELEAMKLQLAAAEARAEREAREREADRREQQMRDQMAAQAADTKRMIEMMQQQYQQLQTQMLAQQNRGPDPMVQLLIEQNRNSTDAMKEISRQTSTAIDKYATFMMSPRDVMQMQRDQSNGLDTVSEKLTKVYGNVLDMHQKVLENALQLNQGGNETVGLIRDGITSAKEAFERYVGVKSKAEQVKQQSAAQTATAQAQAQAIQAQATVEVARINNMPVPIQQPAQQARPQPVPQSGFGNASPPKQAGSFAEWKRQEEARVQAIQAGQAAGTQSPSGQHVPTPGNGVQTSTPMAQGQVPSTINLRRGKTDEYWFGPTLGEVVQVRQAVALFLAGLEHGKFEGATPQAVADGILQAHALVMMNQIPVPAMIELLNQSMYTEFVEVLLPDDAAPNAKGMDNLRSDIVKLLREKLDGETDDDDDEDADDDDGEGPHDDVQDGEVEKPKPRVRIVTKPAARA